MIHQVSVLSRLATLRVMIACFCSLSFATEMFSPQPAADAATLQSQPQYEEVRQLMPGAPVRREISGGQSHVWQVNLSAGDYLRLSVARDQTKLAAKLFAPGSDGQDEKKPLLSTIDRNVIFEHGSKFVAIFSFVAEVSGTYRLETSLLDKNLAQVQYEVKIEVIRPATPNDKLRVAAERTELEGDLDIDNDATLERQLLRVAKYDASLALWREMGDGKSELRLLRKIGGFYLRLGEPQTSLRYHNQAIQIARDLGDRYQEANLALSVGQLQRSQGDNQKALDTYNQARGVFASLSARLGEAIAIERIGGIYLSLGEARLSLDYLNQALQTYLTVGEPFGQSNALNTLGLARRYLGEKQEALELHTRALEIARKHGEVGQESASLGHLGSAHLALGDRQKAADYYNQQLTMCQRIGSRRCLAAALNSLGNISFLLGEKEKALDYLSQSLNVSRLAGERDWEAGALYALARTNYSIGNLSEARKQIETALEIREFLRANLARQDLRASFFGSVQSGFDLYVDLLMSLHQQQPAAGHDAAALQASERARARNLLEQLAEANADIRQGVDQQLLESELTLQQRINAKAAARARLLNDKGAEAQAASFDKEIAELTARYREIQAQIRSASPHYAALTQPQPLTADEIKQMLDDNTVLLEFALGEKRSWLWAVTRNTLSSYKLPPRPEIEAASRKVYELLTARQPKKGLTESQQKTLIAEADAKFQTEAAAMSKMLLGQIAPRLQQEWKGKRLAIVASGALEYLPFAALPSPDRETKQIRNPQSAIRNPQSPQPLIADHEVVNLPSASVLTVIRRETAGRQPAPKTLALIADPVFEPNDPRVLLAVKKNRTSDNLVANVRSADESPAALPVIDNSNLARATRSFNRAGFSRLPFSREEAETIADFVPKNSLLKATDFQANRTMATSGALGRYRIVHFATHGLLNSELPELSGLVLSLVDENGKTQEGFLRMHEIYNLQLPADLVVLSACQTALGKEIKGEGLVGLTRGFMHAGAERVVASLWQVDDLATAQLMQRFYRGMLKDGMRPAAALRAAQIETMKQKRWASPYFWAAFTMQGEWR